jgi:hypothetical protein
MIDHIASVPVLTLLILLSTLFPAVIFPVTGIGDNKPLDLYLFYTPDQVYDYLSALGDKGRTAYAKMESTSDLLFPVVYSLALTVALVMGVRKTVPSGSRLRHLRFFPLLIVIADWCENLSLILMLHAFPDRLDAIATAAGLFTSIKWTFIILAFVTLVTVGVLVVYKHCRDSRIRRC